MWRKHWAYVNETLDTLKTCENHKCSFGPTWKSCCFGGSCPLPTRCFLTTLSGVDWDTTEAFAIAMFRRCSSSCVRGPWHQCWGKVMGCTITIQHHYSWRKSLSTNGITSHRGILNTVDGTILHHSRVYENVLLLGYSHCFVHPEWCRISSFNSMFCKYDC